MATYRTPGLSLDDQRIPEKTLDYFRRHLRYEVHEQIVRAFSHQKKDPRIKLTKAKLARRLNRNAALVTRYLAGPSNWTLDTLSDLMVGMGIDPRAPFAAVVAQQEREDAEAAQDVAENRQNPVRIPLLPSDQGADPIAAILKLRESRRSVSPYPFAPPCQSPGQPVEGDEGSQRLIRRLRGMNVQQQGAGA